jgi:hypothetical protein
MKLSGDILIAVAPDEDPMRVIERKFAQETEDDGPAGFGILAAFLRCPFGNLNSAFRGAGSYCFCTCDLDTICIHILKSEFDSGTSRGTPNQIWAVRKNERDAASVLSSSMPVQEETRGGSDAAAEKPALASSLMAVPESLGLPAVKNALEPDKASRWNMHNLGLRAGADAASAAAAGFLVAPLVCTIDR